MDEWAINKTLGQCFGTDRTLVPGEEYFAALVETEEGLQRRDYCREYWEQNKPQVFCFWKTRLADLDKKKQIFVDDEMLMAFFERLAGETEEDKVNFRFVLTLILMRKRKLKYDSSRNQDGKEIWRLRIVGGDKNYVEVVNPHLADEQIEQLSLQLGQILQTDLE
ncbi:MAG: hypothetical protein ACYTBP_05015 [Planctomycetota bacterium]|jgi:hypothetical protein